MQKIFYILLLLIVSSLVYAQNKLEGLQHDKAPLSVRQTDKVKLEEFRKDDDYNYLKTKEAVKWRDAFVIWLDKMLQKLFSNEGASPIVRYIIIGLFIFVVLLIVYNTNLMSVFIFNRKNITAHIEISEEDINRIDFEHIINAAVAEGNFRKATRYLYLKLLKRMSDHQIIKWKNDKTNYDYYVELNDNSYRKIFKRLTQHYEYIWYGNFETDLILFQKIHTEFNNFFNNFESTNPIFIHNETIAT